jgi:hypothetical protein
LVLFLEHRKTFVAKACDFNIVKSLLFVFSLGMVDLGWLLLLDYGLDLGQSALWRGDSCRIRVFGRCLKLLGHPRFHGTLGRFSGEFHCLIKCLVHDISFSRRVWLWVFGHAKVNRSIGLSFWCVLDGRLRSTMTVSSLFFFHRSGIQLLFDAWTFNSLVLFFIHRFRSLLLLLNSLVSFLSLSL